MRTIYFSIVFLIFLSCEKVDCTAIAKSYRKENCKIIVKKIPIPESRHNFYIIGKSITTNKDTVYDEENRWFCQLYKYIQKGDTIIKQKGTTIFNIHKSDTVLKFYYDCNGKFYK